MRNGIQIQPDEQQQLLAHSRAITERLPDNMNPIAVGQSEGVSFVTTAQPAPSGKVLAFPSSPTSANSNQAQPLPNNCSEPTKEPAVPTNSEGCAENPDAYKLWKQKPVEGESVTPQQFREKLAALAQRLTMHKH